MSVSVSRAATGDQRLASIVDELIGRLQAGDQVDLQAFAASHPDCADQLQEIIPALEFLTDLPKIGLRRRPQATDTAGEERTQTAAGPVGGMLGDFRIVREIGRGGMGVVYEAEQISLKRRVALKVLPFAAVLDQRQLQRFKNEAQAAAALDHPNIVHVYSVGCERAVHFYAMQYVEGQTLAQVIEELRRVDDPDSPAGDSDSPRPSPANGDAPIAEPPPSTHGLVSALTETRRQAQEGVSTEASTRTVEFFRCVANLGIQAAGALEHAHQMGVVHRDIKPSNLMTDAEGHLWIADFGLAMTQTDTNLTMTGDLLGTLRYMSPEQVQAKHGVLDHRTDVYSLGITLCEMLTLQPAFASDDRQRIMSQIIEEDPPSPRQLNGAVPKDLETIVLKAIAKEPQARYATAAELADDLRRFVEDKPIRARRPRLAARVAKWSRRHRPAVWSAIAVLVMAVVAMSVSTLLIAGAYEAEAAQRKRADRTVDSLLDHMEEAIQGLARRNGLTEVGQLVDYATELDARLPDEVRGSSRHRSRLASMQYQRGWGCARLGRHEAAERSLRAAIAIYEKLAAEDPDRYNLLLARCYYYLDDVLRSQGKFEDATRTYDRVLELSGVAEGGSVGSASSRRGLDHVRDERDDLDPMATKDGLDGLDAEIRHYQKKLAAARDRRGDLYVRQGRLEEALSDYGEALRLTPVYAEAYWDRGNAYLEKRDYDRAIADFTEAIRLNPASSYACNQRGLAHERRGEIDKAIADYSQAIEIHLDADAPSLSPGVAIRNLATNYVNRGRACFKLGRPDRALADLSEAIRVDPKRTLAYYWRGKVHEQSDDLDRAVAAFSEAIRLDPTYVLSYVGRGVSQIKAGRFEQAIADFDEAIRRDPELSCAYFQRGLAFCRGCDLDRAVEDLEKAVALSPHRSSCRVGLGIGYGKQHRFDLALDELNVAISSAENPWAYSSRGRIYVARGYEGDAARARNDFDKAISLHENSVETYHCRAEVLVELNEMQAALADANRARNIGTRSLEARLRAAWFLATCRYPALRDGPRAVELAEELTTQVPDSGAAWKIFGAAWYRVGEYAKAQEALERAGDFDYHAVDFYGSNGPGWFFLAMAHAKQHNDREARRWYDKAVRWMNEHRPDDEELRRFRDEAARELGATATTQREEDEQPD